MRTSSIVSAHQSGCHRFHSCESDTGSYVCGDLGYYSECGYGPPEPVVDEAERGGNEAVLYIDTAEQTNLIKEAAQSNGSTDGTDDYRNNDEPTPNKNTDYCTGRAYNITINGNSGNDFDSAFRDTYETRCKVIYKPLYSSSYTVAYDAAEQTTAAANAPELESSAANTPKTTRNPFIFILPIAGLLGSVYLFMKRKKV